jgi:hypothetical protein
MKDGAADLLSTSIDFLPASGMTNLWGGLEQGAKILLDGKRRREEREGRETTYS